MTDQLGGDAGLTLGRRARNFRLPDPANFLFGVRGHNQGVTVLRDTLVDGNRFARAALSFNANDDDLRGLLLAAREIPNTQQTGIDNGNGRLDYSVRARQFDVTDVEEYGDHHHPGGIQAQGDLLAIAMEQPRGPDNRAAVYFVRVDGMTPRHVATHWLGGQPAGLDVRLNAASAVGFTRRAQGGFVMAVSGADNGRAGVWFYLTDDAQISASTRWQYVDFWDPSEELSGKLCGIGSGRHGLDCYVGGGGATSLVSDCDGRLYLVAQIGTDRTPGDEFEYAQIFRIEQDSSSGEVHLRGLWSSRRNLGRWGVDNVQYRFGAGAQVLPGNRLALLSTERHTREEDNDWVDGMMRIAGSNTRDL